MFNSSELATVLVALRHWQQYLHECEIDPTSAFPQFSEERPLSAKQIDRLCERLNESTELPSAANHA